MRNIKFKVLVLLLFSNHVFATNIDDLNWIYHLNLPYTSTNQSTGKPEGTAIKLAELITQELSPS